MASTDLAELKSVYLIHGSEDVLLDRAVKRLRDRVAAVADLDFNMDTFEAEESSVDDILTAANTMPFMSDKRLVVVRGVERLTAEQSEPLVAYAKDPAPYTCLVLVAAKVNKNTRLYRAVAALGGAFEYAAPKRGEYPAEVTRALKEAGKTISGEAAQAVIALVGRDLRRIEAEAGKLAAYVGERDEVALSDVEAVTAKGASASVFDYLDAVGSRDVGKALRLLKDLLGSGESPVGVHAMTVRHVRALIGARALTDRGESPDRMAPRLGMPPWLARNVAAQASRWERGELSRALRDAAAADAEMKTSPVDAGLVLQRWVVENCRRA